MNVGRPMRPVYHENIFVRAPLKQIEGFGANVLALGAVADFGAQNCQYTTKVDAR
jgi:hypothetical protein